MLADPVPAVDVLGPVICHGIKTGNVVMFDQGMAYIAAQDVPAVQDIWGHIGQVLRPGGTRGLLRLLAAHLHMCDD